VITNRSVEPHSANLSVIRQFWRVLKRIFYEFSEDRILTVAGGITFFLLLALFPAIGAIVSLSGLFLHGADFTQGLDSIARFLPEGGVTVLRAELLRLSGQKPATLNVAFVVSLLVALWSASGGFKALVEGLNIAFEVRETRNFVRLTLYALIFTAVAILLSAMVVILGSLLQGLAAASSLLRLSIKAATWPSLFLASSFFIAVIYRFGPNRPKPQWRWITWGSALASLLWVCGTQLFTWYVQHYGSYNRVYGNLGAAVGFLTWIWLSLVSLLLGAEINSELERQTEESEAAFPGQRSSEGEPNDRGSLR